MWLILSMLSSAHPAQIAGVSMPDTATVAGQSISLNGLGVRERHFVDVYIGALYLQTPTTDASAAIAADEPKRIAMYVLFERIAVRELADTFRHGFGSVPGGGAQDAALETLCGMMEDVTAGDKVILDYAPGDGTTVSVKGQVKGTIAGADFMRTLWGVYLGPDPPSAKLRRGMLGL